MSGKTGEECKESGVYRCSVHTSQTIPLAKGNRFPPCSMSGGHAATWQLVQKA
jgi:hypothetical protein